MAETAVRGYEHLAAMTDRDACLEARMVQCRDKARSWSLILPAVTRNAVNPLERKRSNDLYERAGRLFGQRLWERAAGFATIALAGLWKLRLKIFGDRLQPRTIVTRYPAGCHRRHAGRRECRVGCWPQRKSSNCLRLPPPSHLPRC